MSSSGTWTPVVAGANTTSTEGTWYRIGDVTFMRGQIYFDSTQTNQGLVYISMSSLPLNGGHTIMGLGDSPAGIWTLTSNIYINNNILLQMPGVAGLLSDATSTNVKGQRFRFMLIAMPNA